MLPGEATCEMLEQIRTIELIAPSAARLPMPMRSVANEGTTAKKSATTAHTDAPVTATRANAARMSRGTLGRGMLQAPPRGRPGSGIVSSSSAATMQAAMPTT